MLDFKPLSLEHRQKVQEFLCREKAIHTEGSFNVLYVWNEIFETKICFQDGFMFICSQSEGKIAYQMPRGNGDLSHAVKLILNDAKERGCVPRLISITEKMREQLENALPGVFEFNEQRDSFDYIYNASDLITLTGRKFNQKRNNVNKFKKNFEGRYEYQNFTSQDIPEVYEFQKKWLEKNSTPERVDGLTGEMRVIERLFKSFDELNYVGGLIRVDNEIVAYTVGSRLCSDTFVISLEKADIEYPGIYQAINQFFAAANCTDVKYINREDDAGVPGLRKAKLSYNPAFLLVKYEAVLK